MDSPLPIAPFAQIIGGLLILFLGRRLFWLFVGVVGFFFGLQFGAEFFDGIASWLLVVLAVVTGLVCAGLAVLLQRLAVAVAGGIAGGLLAMRLAPAAGLHTESGMWVAFIIGAFLAAVLLSALFDPVLIVLSSLTGALMIAEAVSKDPLLLPLVFCLCLVAGLVVQFRSYARQRAAPV